MISKEVALFMEIDLICSDSIKSILKDLLLMKGFSYTETAELCLIEKGQSIPPGKLSIVFENDTLPNLLELLDTVSKHQKNQNPSIIGKSMNDSYEIITYDRILYFENRGNNVFCITQKDDYKIKDKLYSLEEILPKNYFCRISKSYIVNISSIKEIIPWFGGRLILRFINSQHEVEVSRRNVKSFKQILGM